MLARMIKPGGFCASVFDNKIVSFVVLQQCRCDDKLTVEVLRNHGIVERFIDAFKLGIKSAMAEGDLLDDRAALDIIVGSIEIERVKSDVLLPSRWLCRR